MSEEYANPFGGDFSLRKKPQEKIIGSELEKRGEKLGQARKSILEGSHMHLLDAVDISECEYLKTVGGIYEIVHKGTVVGYSREPIVLSSEEIIVH